MTIKLLNFRVKLLIRLKDTVHQILREEQSGFWEGESVCHPQIFALWLTIDKCLSHQALSIFNFIDCD